jgi:hypothetical protein
MSQQAVDAQRIDQLFQWQLEEFERHFEDHPIPKEQDLRAGAVAWVAVFAPELVSKASRAHLHRTRQAAYQFPDFAYHGWYRVAYLDVATFALTGERGLLDTVIDNLDHHSSQLRVGLHAPLALVADRLSWADERLLQRIASSLQKSHFYNDSLLCLYCAVRGSTREKAAVLLTLRGELNLAPQDRETVNKLLKGDYLNNTAVSEEIQGVGLWLLHLLSMAALSVRIDGVQPDPVEARANSLTVGDFWRRMTIHPLLKPLIKL